jgi:hypothetical protein
MTLNAIIDISIGLMAMYLVLSLICTGINELISSLVALRAKYLRRALDQLINHPGVRTAFDRHGLVAGAKTKSDPSYISGQTFALALIDCLTPGTPVPTLNAVQAAATALPPSNIRDVVLSNIAVAAGNIDTLRTNLAASFDRSMERVSGAYKRHLALISLAVGVGLAAALNADSIAVGRMLWASQSRGELMQMAQQALTTGSEKGSPVLGDGTMSADDIAANYDKLVGRIDAAAKLLRPLPIGWQFSTAKPKEDLTKDAKLVEVTLLERISLKVLGLLLTGVALMLGAPFWFDVLSKFMRLRFTGDKPNAK